MPAKTRLSLPSLKRLMQGLGENIRRARLRRKLSAEQVAQRAGMNRRTLSDIEKGTPSVTIGSYLNVLHVLGLHEDVLLVAKDDELGRKLQDADLLIKERAPRKISKQKKEK